MFRIWSSDQGSGSGGSLAPSEDRAGPLSVTVVVFVLIVLVGRAGGALAFSHSLIVMVFGVFGGPGGSLALVRGAGPLSVTLFGVWTLSSSGFSISVPGVLSFMWAQTHGVGEGQQSSKGQENLETHLDMLVKIIDLDYWCCTNSWVA